MGYFITLLASLLLAFSITIVHFAYVGGIVAEQVVLVRFLIATIGLFFVVIALQKHSIGFIKDHFHKNWIISLMFIIQTYGYVSSIQYIPVGLATIIFYTFPLITYIMQIINGEEKISTKNILAIILGLTGVYFTIDIKSDNIAIEGVIYAAVAAVAQAFAGVASQSRLRQISAEKMMLITSIQCSILLPLLFIGFYGFDTTIAFFDITPYLSQAIGVNGLAYAMLSSVFFITGITLFFYAIRLSTASKVSIIMFSEPAFTVLVAAVLIGEIVLFNQFVGLSFIMLAGVITQYQRKTARNIHRPL